MSEYRKQANLFAEKHKIKLRILFYEYKKKWDDDKQPRYVFRCKLTRNRKSYTFDFGQSYAAGAEQPDMYQILVCLTKYDPENFEEFCSCYDYDNDSIKALKTYNAVVKEWQAVERLFGDILEELREIE